MKADFFHVADEAIIVARGQVVGQVSSEGSHRTWVGPRNVRITLRDDGGRGVLPIYVRRTVAAIDAAQDE